MDSEADEAEEHEESPSRSNEDGIGGDAREGSDSEVDSRLQIQRTERSRGSREPVLRGVPMVGKGKRNNGRCAEKSFGRTEHASRRVGTTEYASTSRATASDCYIARCG